jgi:tryptophan synthase beta chain
VIGLEAKKQLALAGVKKPDVVIGCAGGGSNFAGISFPFVQDKIAGAKIEILPVEPSACPTLTRGPFVYDFGDTAGLTPLLAMYSLGHAFIPPAIHAGGLRYHGMAPLVSQATVDGLVSPRAYGQTRCFEAAMTWARTEGPIPAPETSHAIACVIDEANKAREEGKEKNILFCYSGHGLLDLGGYEKYLSGELADYELPEADLCKALEPLRGFPKPHVAGAGRKAK